MAATIARVLLGLVFLTSGTLKLRDRSWPTAAASLGTPQRIIPLVAPVEIVIGALVVAGVAAMVVTAIAIALLVAFSAVILRALRRPVSSRPTCACFGRFSSRPVDGWSLLRNGLFIALGVVSLGL